jgi:ribokinase
VAWNNVVVVGMAVMDTIFRIPSMPNPDQSVQVDDFELHPGGKGLTQAVAAARMGFDVALVAAIGDDVFGDQIVEYLQREGVKTNHIRRVQGEQTPVTAVITYRSGGQSIALGWKNEEKVGLRRLDIETPGCTAAIQEADFVFCTFEPSAEVVSAALTAAKSLRRSDGRTPITVLTPAPPYERSNFRANQLRNVDFFVANDWEARNLLDSPKEDEIPEICKALMAAGVKHVCIVVVGQCFAYWRGDHAEFARWPGMVKETAGARDAFCAALARKLADNEGNFEPQTIFWATAAMAAASGMVGVPNSMPTPEDVELVMQTHVDAFPSTPR